MQYDPERQAEELLAKSLQLETGNLMQVYEGIRRRLLDEGQLRSARSVEGTDGKRKAMCLKAGCRGYAITASKKQANCTGGKSICGYHAQWGCTTCEEGKADFKRCIC